MLFRLLLPNTEIITKILSNDKQKSITTKHGQNFSFDFIGK